MVRAPCIILPKFKLEKVYLAFVIRWKRNVETYYLSAELYTKIGKFTLSS